MQPDSGVLSIEFKVNFLSPAVGDKFLGIGRVIKAGRNITVCSGEVLSFVNGTEKLIAAMQATMMTVAKPND
jgi:acyl-coenzyme A thioesterase PaaI-like protein